MKNYNLKNIFGEARKIVKEACYSPQNKFTSTVWEYHILPVVKYGLNLGKKFNADLEVIELAALLHDYACLIDSNLCDEHHLHSADLAEKLLDKFDFPKYKIEHIRECIISHRGSLNLKKESVEAKILASADAMAHITEWADMFYLTYGVHKYQTREGAEWLKGKVERSWNKIIPEGKDMIKDDYEIMLKIINRAIK